MLMPRSYPGAVITDPEIIAQRALSMVKDRCVVSSRGRRIDCEIDTLCIHGDNDASIRAASIIRELGQNDGIRIKALGA
jgi:UPF0271 protein